MATVGSNDVEISGFGSDKVESLIREASYTNDTKAIVSLYVDAFEKQEQYSWIFQTKGQPYTTFHDLVT